MLTSQVIGGKSLDYTERHADTEDALISGCG